MTSTNLTQITGYFYLSLLGGLAFLFSACSTAPAKTVQEAPVNPNEMYVWIPPSAQELELRRTRQETLDDISGEIENLFLKQQALDRQTQGLKSTIAHTVTNNQSLESDIEARIKFQKLQQEQFKNELAKLNISQEIIKSNLRTLEAMRSEPKRVYSQSDYTAAIRLLKEGKYKRSIHKFNEALHSHPPASMEDNIRFGLGTAYYKLRKYSKAIEQLNAIIKKHPHQDKWHISHVMLGMIHNSKGEKSKALYVLHQALSSHPPDSMRRMIDRTIQMIEEGKVNAEG